MKLINVIAKSFEDAGYIVRSEFGAVNLTHPESLQNIELEYTETHQDRVIVRAEYIICGYSRDLEIEISRHGLSGMRELVNCVEMIFDEPYTQSQWTTIAPKRDKTSLPAMLSYN